MRAWVYERYGSVDELRLREVPTPAPARGEVLVEVVATSVNLSDWEALRGSPGYARLDGLFAPRTKVLGSDVAGRVVAVGDDVARFRPGDDVYGDNLPRRGGFAEYVVMPEKALAHKPATLTFAEASTIPQSGAIALQAVASGAPGQRLLVNGAGGGTGSFLVQLAVARGMHVTGVDAEDKLDFVRRLGAQDVIDYRRTDFTRTGPYDLVVDLVAYRSVFAYRRALARRGRCLMVGGTLRALLRMVTVGPVVGALTGARLGVLLVRSGPRRFGPLADLCAAGEVAIHVDRTFRLAEVPAALTVHGTGRARGKVVVVVRDV
ncbi:NAD(P)-dependent alcohol dehydrogenase [Cellulosimicrobium sp. Marseille-Q4280]|uniref:NAD(P)-dependent alcohol dehydrogenase n=1 Tax=Cellulosimicrobium sp. Marseille-Q4280 TaxID=2937992 RepID=UPI0020406534|nr:NAD(P)-dependent alcohol dehydrogenase [Cellulosimicrobium sp. Marseille-Q4280]